MSSSPRNRCIVTEIIHDKEAIHFILKLFKAGHQGFRNGISLDNFYGKWIDGIVIDTHFVVKMGTCCQSGHAHISYDLSLF